MLGYVTILASCGSPQEEEPTLVIGAIPDQQVSQLQRRIDLFTEYIEQEVGVQAEYNPSSDYAALVTAFKRGEVHLAWFGGLTGVQARLAVPEAQAIAQRPRDQTFRSVLVVGEDSGIETLDDLKGKRVTFGSESSTSGHLMPR
jgi:phosphonate transport system substrate-binding protein